MNSSRQQSCDEETGVQDVRRVREQIAAQHKGNLAAHVAETNRIAEAFRDRLRLGRVVRTTPRGETSATSAVSLTRHGFLATLPVVAVW